MQQTIQHAPLGLQAFEQRIDLRVGRDVARQDRTVAKIMHKLDGPFLQLLAGIRKCERCALALARARHAIGDRAVGQKTGDQDFLVGENTHDRRVCASAFRVVS